MKKIKNVMILFLCLAVCASLAACKSTGADTASTSKAKATTKEQIPDPWTNCNSLDEAIKISGINISVPDSIDGYPTIIYRAMKDSTVEIIYRNGNEEIRVRKAAGSDDISGDYNNYSQTKIISSGDISVTEKGNNDKISLATWTNGNYTYSITFDPAVTSDYVQNTAAQIK